jgi:hypothetical protein
MNKFNLTTLFCEDIREEKNNTFTLIGILPDQINLEILEGGAAGADGVPTAPPPPPRHPVKTLPKLSIYIRINFDPAFDIGAPIIRVILPGGQVSLTKVVEKDIIQKAMLEAKQRGNLLAGVVSRVNVDQFRPAVGSIKVEAEINGETHLGGAINFRLVSKPSSTTH